MCNLQKVAMFRYLGCLIACSMLSVTVIAQNTQPARERTPADADPSAWRQERGTELQQIPRLVDQGRGEDAIAMAQRVVEKDRAIWGEKSNELAESTTVKAAAHEALDQGDLALASREKIRDIVGALYPASDWHVTDAKLAWESTKQRNGLSLEQRRELIEADRLLRETQQQAWDARARDPRSIVMNSKRAWEIRARILGEEHVETVEAMHAHGWWAGIIGGDMAKSGELLNRAVELKTKILGSKHPSTATAQLDAAGWLRGTGRLEDALALLLKCSELRKDLHGESSREFHAVRLEIVRVYSEQGRYLDALRECEWLRAQQAKTPGSNRVLPRVLLALGDAHKALGDLSAAEQCFQQALVLQRQQPPSDLIGQITFSLSELYYLRGQLEEAELRGREALALAEQLFGPRSAQSIRILHMLGRIELERGRYVESIQTLTEAIAILEIKRSSYLTQKALYLTDLGEALRRNGELVAALERHEEARKLLTPSPANLQIARMLERKADTLENLDRRPEAREHYGQAIQVRIAVAESWLMELSEAEAMIFVRDTHRALGRYVSLVEDEPAAIAQAYEVMWKTRGIATRSWLVKRRLARAHPTVNNLLRTMSEIPKQLSMLANRTDLPMREAQISELLQKKESLERQIGQQLTGYSQIASENPSSVSDFLRALPNDVCVVEIIRSQRATRANSLPPASQTSDSYLAFVVRQSPNAERKTQAIYLGSRDAIDEALRTWLACMVPLNGRGLRLEERAPKEPSLEPTAATGLGTLVWPKLKPAVAGCSTVIIAADGLLSRIPWSAIIDGESGQRLVEQYAFVSANYGQQVAQFLVERPNAEGGTLIVGAVDYEHPASQTKTPLAGGGFRGAPFPISGWPQWQFLPGTESEITAVEELARKRGPVVRLTGAAANESALREAMGNARHIHLATHGFGIRSPSDLQSSGKRVLEANREVAEPILFKAGRSPLIRTGLVASGANHRPEPSESTVVVGDDGILTAEEILDLNLNRVELVVLSACETARGWETEGEGVFALQRAFHHAGAESVISSLWMVEDRVTTDLMTAFYRNLWDKKLSKAESLRQAQLTVGFGLAEATQTNAKAPPTTTKAQLAPELWAAWTLSGDWR
jgi:CHAT domain-containing protein/tetratricopeptide (TPR) repeat protein